MSDSKTKSAATSKHAHERRSTPSHTHSSEVSEGVREFLRLVKRSKNRGAVLDLGCGDGKSAIFFARHGFEGHGVDSHPESIKRARAYASRTGVSESTHFRVSSVFTLPYPERFFDVGIDFGCLHHLHKYDWEQYLESIKRVLKPDAFYMLTVYSLRDKHVPGRKRQYVIHQGHYDYFFSKKEIRDLFEKDFDIINMSEEALVTLDGKKHVFHHAHMRRKYIFHEL